MRQLFVAAIALMAVGTLQANTPQDKKAEIKGLHLCCGNCVKSVQEILGKVEGVSDVNCDRKAKLVIFAAKDQKAAEKALDALMSGGFFGTATYGDVGFGRPAGVIPGKTNAVTVKGVHACCGQCNGIIKGLFKDAKVTISGKGAQKDVLITGTDLEPNAIRDTLQKAGFNGQVEAKK